MAPFEAPDFYAIDDLLSEEERLTRDTVRSWVTDRFMPLIEEAYREGRFPRALIPEMGELGVLGGNLDYGDFPRMSSVAYGLVMQELERGDSGLRSFVSVQGALVMYPIWRYGSDEQKARWLPAMHAGKAVGCFGLTEPDHGSDPGGMETKAVRDGSGFVLNGAKMWITNGDLCDVAVVWGQLDGVVRGFLVERGTKGFSTREQKRKHSLRASVTSELVLQDVHLPASAMLPLAQGLGGPLSCLTQARYGIAWGVIGAAQACLAQMIDYTKTRVLFGRPLAENQAIQIRLADMSRRITTAQLLALQLGRLKDKGEMVPSHVSLAKWNNCRMALDIARDARDMLGGAGISAEFVPIRHMLNLESVITYEGTETVHQLTIGRELTGINAF